MDAFRPRSLTGEPGRDRLREMADAATHKFTENAEEIAGKTAKRARDNADKTQQAVKHFKPYVERSIKDHLMATLAVAPVIGFVLGALWRKQVDHV